MTTTDPRALHLAQHRQRVAHEPYGTAPVWNALRPDEQQLLVEEADTWLRAAVAAGIAPAATRPNEDHNGVYVDEQGLLYGEYRASPGTDQVYLLRLLWVDEMAIAKSRLEEEGATFQHLGWCL